MKTTTESVDMGLIHAKHVYENSKNLMGKDPSEIRLQNIANHGKYLESFNDFKGVEGEPWFGGEVKLSAFIYGKLTADIKFGDDGWWRFTGTVWGAGGAVVTTGGGGPWAYGFTSPYEGQEMKFEVTTAAVSGGIIKIFWWVKGQGIQGSFVGLAGGVGIIEGGGHGVWKKIDK